MTPETLDILLYLLDDKILDVQFQLLHLDPSKDATYKGVLEAALVVYQKSREEVQSILDQGEREA